MKVKNSSKIVSPLIFILLWFILSFIINAVLILPYPHTVVLRLFQLLQTKRFWLAFSFTMLRVLAAFFISFAGGFFLGLLSADSLLFKNMISFPLAVIRSTPLVAFILIALFWFKSDTVPVFVAVVMSLPVMITAAEKGFEKNPENLEKLFKAESRNFTGFMAFRYLRLPSAMPSILSGTESSFGLCWKVVVAGEVLSLPHYASGSLMQQAQVHLETSDTMAITLAIIITSYFCGRIFNHKGNKNECK